MKKEEKYNITFKTWDKVAKLYEDKFMDIDLYDDTYDLFCELVEKESPKILEIGCGPGNVTRYLLCERPDFEILGIDISSNMLDLAQLNNQTADFEEMDCRKIDTLTERYDGIMCGFTIPYLAKDDCSNMIQNCANLLNDKGQLYVSFIEGFYDMSEFETGSTGDQVFVYYYEEVEIKTMLIESGFKINETFVKIYMKNGAAQYHMIVLAELI